MACVYILQNKEAQRIKIGATLNNPDARLLDINRMWSGIKGRCQICLNWRMLNDGRLPNHVLTMKHCPGSGELPFEYSIDLAEKQLLDLEENCRRNKGAAHNFATKRIKNLRNALVNYKENPVRIGKWELLTSYKTDSAYLIEKVVHKALVTHLDKTAPFGEVFLCSVDEAVSVIEEAIKLHRA